MNSPQDWTPAEVDENRPSAARAWDYYLGGFTNFEVDRQLAERALKAVPDGRNLAIMSRRFLGRAVRHLVGAGITQFLDLGSGIPTAGNVHEIAQRENPDARVIYVDHEPVAIQHSRHLLEGNDNAEAVLADLRDTRAVLNAAGRLLDFDRPVAVLCFAVLHFVPDDPHAIVARYRDATVPGSYLAVAHFTGDGRPDVVQAAEQYRASPTPLVARPHAEIAEFFDGYELLDPGLVFTPLWRPEDPEEIGEHPERSAFYAGLGIKR